MVVFPQGVEEELGSSCMLEGCIAIREIDLMAVLVPVVDAAPKPIASVPSGLECVVGGPPFGIETSVVRCGDVCVSPAC